MIKISHKLVKVIMLSTLILFVLSACGAGDEHAEEITAYLQSNHAVIDLAKEDNPQILNLLEPSFANTEIFLAGEIHGIAYNHDLAYLLLKTLQQKADVRYLLEEMPYSTSRIINKYLQTGDESLLQQTFVAAKGTFNWTKERYNTWVKIYELNQSLPTDKKLQLVGIDIEHQNPTAINYLNSLLPAKPIAREISGVIQELQNLQSTNQYDNQAVEEVCLLLKDSIEHHKTTYQELLGEAFFDFQFVNNNLLGKFEVYAADSKDFNQVRDAKMHNNFTVLYPALIDGKCFGQWGLNHIFQKQQNGVDWVASRMVEEPELKGKIVSIAYAYNDCQQMLNRTYKVHEQNTFNDKLTSIKQYADHDLTLFKLAGSNSPFSRHMIWPFHKKIGKMPQEGATTDYFQFLILINNSQPTEPYGIVD